VDPAVTKGIGIREMTSKVQVVPDVAVLKQRIGRGANGATGRGANGATLAKRLVRQDAQDLGLANNVDRSEHRTKGHAWKSSVLACGEVIFAFIKAKTKMKFPHVFEGCVQETELIIDENVLGIVEDEVRGYKSKNRLVAPGACIGGVRDAGISLAGSLGVVGARLTVFGNTRASEKAKAQPVINSMLRDEKDGGDA
jgi:hypothetical protein